MIARAEKRRVSNREFLEAVFRDMPSDAAATTAGFPGDPNAQPLDGPDYRWAAIPWQRGQPLPDRLSSFGPPYPNTYFAISSFRRDPADGNFRRRKANFAQLHCVMVDDVGTKVHKRKLRLALSALIETSPSNFQGFYLIKPSAVCKDRPACERLIDGMVRSGLTADGADPGMRGVTRYGRLPIGVNGKGKYVAKLGHPFECQLVQWAPKRRYTIEKIARAYKIDLAVAQRTPVCTKQIPRRRKAEPMALSKGDAVRRVAEFEQMLRTFAEAGMYVSTNGDWHEIVCPWVTEHTDQKPGGSALHNPAASNNWVGGFKCHHGHCEHRSVGDLYRHAIDLRRGAS